MAWGCLAWLCPGAPQSQALIQGAAGPGLGPEHAKTEVGPGSMVAMCDQPPGGHLEWQGRDRRAGRS